MSEIMFNWRKATSMGVSSTRRLWSRLPGNISGAATIEFVLLTPALLTMMALIVFGGEGLEINRKVTMVVRTLADLTTQQTNVGTSSTTYTYTQLLNAASLVIQPYDSSQLALVLSEVSANGAGTGVVTWSKANAQGTALAVGSTVSVPANITTAGYLILGSASYNFAPLQIYFPIASFSITDSLYLAPRVGTSVACCT
jgi:Flp pilus assembly protein TadG